MNQNLAWIGKICITHAHIYKHTHDHTLSSGWCWSTDVLSGVKVFSGLIRHWCCLSGTRPQYVCVGMWYSVFTLYMCAHMCVLQSACVSQLIFLLYLTAADWCESSDVIFSSEHLKLKNNIRYILTVDASWSSQPLKATNFSTLSA